MERKNDQGHFRYLVVCLLWVKFSSLDYCWPVCCAWEHGLLYVQPTWRFRKKEKRPGKGYGVRNWYGGPQFLPSVHNFRFRFRSFWNPWSGECSWSLVLMLKIVSMLTNIQTCISLNQNVYHKYFYNTVNISSTWQLSFVYFWALLVAGVCHPVCRLNTIRFISTNLGKTYTVLLFSHYAFIHEFWPMK